VEDRGRPGAGTAHRRFVVQISKHDLDSERCEPWQRASCVGAHAPAFTQEAFGDFASYETAGPGQQREWGVFHLCVGDCGKGQWPSAVFTNLFRRGPL
jgi:hypothetical protein